MCCALASDGANSPPTTTNGCGAHRLLSDVCHRAQLESRWRRHSCCAALYSPEGILLIDAGLPSLAPWLSMYTQRCILLTHYHMDHVQGLFPLRWGVGKPIPVYGPPDPAGCDDLFKHPGMLDFKPPLTAFQPLHLNRLRIPPVPLNHSRPTLGYLIETSECRIAYLTDTVGLPDETLQFLEQQGTLDRLIIDCTEPPAAVMPRNHNDLTSALHIHVRLRPQETYLTHIGHALDVYLQTHVLPQGVQVARDGMSFTL
ncbi:phosphonate metabolism protein PhnP [Zymobacter sp. IVIA_12111.31 C1]|uniref:phosphonate metabolism protein PhnP n=1 Tax=Zymobacter sp. IVIA_12111.31 C1 TaxID=3394854 RepID=UPI0039C049D7